METPNKETITYDDFKKMDIRIGTIREVEPVEGTDKLLRCQIDFGTKPAPVLDVIPETDSVLTDEELQKLSDAAVKHEQENEGGEDDNETQPEGTVRDIRQIISGIREYYPDYEELVGKQVLYIVNLEPREIIGHMSHGRLMAVGDDRPVFLVPDEPVASGSRVR